PGTLQELISQTMVHWAQESFIQSPALVRAMFSLLHQQYDALGELGRALPKAYAISATSVPDTTALLECLGQIRSLLIVQMGPEEENLMIQSIGCAGSGPRHPLCPPRVLHPHPAPAVSPSALPVPMQRPETPLDTPYPTWAPQISIWTPQIPLPAPKSPPGHPKSPSQLPNLPLDTPYPLPSPQISIWTPQIPLPAPQLCPMLLAKGYPDIGWNPCGGERYLDFLRFAVFVNGESVEENANVVVRLLIR
ncbi:RYR1 protein, partial [Dasyornis broadbenti]|nr:RYR1 protein [Dasyornis broadbenti]